VLEGGEKVAGELVLLGLGVRPEVSLAKSAGLEIGSLGGIRVNKFLQSSDPNILLTV
jgi:NAD(P)H-nitrite reductase large subunit